MNLEAVQRSQAAVVLQKGQETQVLEQEPCLAWTRVGSGD